MTVFKEANVTTKNKISGPTKILIGIISIFMFLIILSAAITAFGNVNVLEDALNSDDKKGIDYVEVREENERILVEELKDLTNSHHIVKTIELNPNYNTRFYTKWQFMRVILKQDFSSMELSEQGKLVANISDDIDDLIYPKNLFYKDKAIQITFYTEDGREMTTRTHEYHTLEPYFYIGHDKIYYKH